MSTFTATRNGITVMVYLLNHHTWTYHAERGNMPSRGTVIARDHYEALEKALAKAGLELSTPWN